MPADRTCTVSLPWPLYVFHTAFSNIKNRINRKSRVENNICTFNAWTTCRWAEMKWLRLCRNGRPMHSYSLRQSWNIFVDTGHRFQFVSISNTRSTCTLRNRCKHTSHSSTFTLPLIVFLILVFCTVDLGFTSRTRHHPSSTFPELHSTSAMLNRYRRYSISNVSTNYWYKF